MFNFPTNAGFRSDKNYAENSQVQKCYEYFYLGSKTTSSTTVLPQSPKRSKAEEEKIYPKKSADEKNKFFHSNEMVIEEETEYCATPKQQQMNLITNNNYNQFAYNDINNDINNNRNKIYNESNIYLEKNIDKSVNICNILSNIKINPNSNNNNTNHNVNSSNNNNDNNIKKNLITKNNFSESFNNLLQNSIENSKPKGNCALKSCNSGSNPNFNYTKFYEAQKLLQSNSAYSPDSTANNLISASTADSPLPLNNTGNLDVKQSCCTNLNLIFNEDYFVPRNSYRNNCKNFFSYISLYIKKPIRNL